MAKMQVFSLFNKGHSREMKHVMKTKTDNVKMTLFDYAYTTASGEHHSRHTQTVVAFEHDSLSLPKFTLSPEGLFSKIGAAIGFQDIDFDEHSEFSKSFVLKGEDEPAIRNFFDRDKLEFFAQRKEAGMRAAPANRWPPGLPRKRRPRTRPARRYWPNALLRAMWW